MSGGERGNISKAANKVASKILPFLGWNPIGPVDENFPCTRPSEHTNGKTAHNHPTDTVYQYFDPYRKKNILLNTDLKSLGKDSISNSSIRKALKSLAATIECARSSEVWADRYPADKSNSSSNQIEGLLFVYNHDQDYKDNLISKLAGIESESLEESNEKKIHTENIKIADGMQVNILDPISINYILSIATDYRDLKDEKERDTTFGKIEEHYFCYPELKLHKSLGYTEYKSCIIENINNPYLIMGYPINNGSKYKKGIVIYYRDKAHCDEEFLYLLDVLSNFQLLRKDTCIDLRIVQLESKIKDEVSANSYFDSAKKYYIQRYKLNNEMAELVNNIKLESVSLMNAVFIPESIGWE
ncbi:hypothetical protein [Acinetobacter modestus]|uniref:hypothetical protein n=1 Tax=Acinetobacter modestus TaxID=1776740 RepID=UPI00301719D6